MKIVGTISNADEAKEVEYVVKLIVVGNRARVLAERGKKVDIKNVL